MYPPDLDAFVRPSILPAHLARLSEQHRERFGAPVVTNVSLTNVSLPLDFTRLNVSAVEDAERRTLIPKLRRETRVVVAPSCSGRSEPAWVS